MTISFPYKDPDEVLDYQLDWSNRLGSDTISSSAWSLVAGSDGALVIDSDSNTSTTTTVWLSAGTLKHVYSLLNRIVTVGGRTMDQTVRLTIRAR